MLELCALAATSGTEKIADFAWLGVTIWKGELSHFDW